jgi:type IV secretory pathway TraG/TraD family ATPase VirD4
MNEFDQTMHAMRRGIGFLPTITLIVLAWYAFNVLKTLWAEPFVAAHWLPTAYVCLGGAAISLYLSVKRRTRSRFWIKLLVCAGICYAIGWVMTQWNGGLGDAPVEISAADQVAQLLSGEESVGQRQQPSLIGTRIIIIGVALLVLIIFGRSLIIYPLRQLKNYSWGKNTSLAICGWLETKGKWGFRMAEQIDPKRLLSTTIASDSGFHGTSRFMTEAEMLSNYHSPCDDNGEPLGIGFVMGKVETIGPGGYPFALRYTGDGGMYVEAPPGAGKTSSLFDTTLLLPGEQSSFVLDIKGRSYLRTGTYRRDIGQRVGAFDPEQVVSSGDDLRINLLTDMIPESGSNMVTRARSMAMLMVPPIPANINEIWDNAARDLLIGIMLWVRCAPDDLLAKIPGVTRDFMGVSIIIRKNARAIIRDIILPNMNQIDPGAHYSLDTISTLLEWDDKTWATVPGTASSALNFLEHDGFRRSFCGQDATPEQLFKLSDFFEPDFDLYVTILRTTLDLYSPAIRLLTGCLFNRLNEEHNRRDIGLPAKVRFMLDEFPALGYCEPMVGGLVAGREFAQLMLITQTFAQLEKHYKNDAYTLIGSCQIQAYFATNDMNAAEKMSKQAGSMTALKRSTSGGAEGSSLQEEARLVLRPDDLLNLPLDEIIMKEKGKPVIKIKSVRSYNDPRFRNRIPEQYRNLK